MRCLMIPNVPLNRLLIASGAFVYCFSILLLFGRGWIFSLIRG